MSIKKSLAAIDEAVLTELINVSQEALNDLGTAKRVAKQLGLSIARVHALGAIAIQLSIEPGAKPDVYTEEQLDLFAADLVQATDEFVAP